MRADRLPRQPEGDQRQDEAEHVAQVVAGVREQSQRMIKQANGSLHPHEK